MPRLRLRAACSGKVLPRVRRGRRDHAPGRRTQACAAAEASELTAQDSTNAAPATSTNGWNGTAGAGFIVFPRYTGGQKLQALPVPLLSINYNETFYVEIERVGVYVLASDDKKIGLGLAVEPRFGFNAADNARLAGMATRRP